MKRRSGEAFPESKRRKSMSKDEPQESQVRSPLHPLTFRAVTMEMRSSPARGIKVGLSPAVKLADHSGKLDDIPEHSPRKKGRRKVISAPPGANRSIDENDDIVKRLRAKLGAKKRKSTENVSTSSSASTGSEIELSAASDVSMVDSEDPELKAAATASARRRIMLQRRSKYRMSVVKRVAEARRASARSSESEQENTCGTNEEKSALKETQENKIDDVQEQRVKLRTKLRKNRPQKSSSEELEHDALKKTEAVSRRTRSKAAQSSGEKSDRESKKKIAKISPIASKSPRFTTGSDTPDAKQEPRPKSSTKEKLFATRRTLTTPTNDPPKIERSVSRSELEGSGLVSSVKKGFEQLESGTSRKLSKRTTPKWSPSVTPGKVTPRSHGAETPVRAEKKEPCPTEKRTDKRFRSEFTFTLGVGSAGAESTGGVVGTAATKDDKPLTPTSIDSQKCEPRIGQHRSEIIIGSDKMSTSGPDVHDIPSDTDVRKCTPKRPINPARPVKHLLVSLRGFDSDKALSSDQEPDVGSDPCLLAVHQQQWTPDNEVSSIGVEKRTEKEENLSLIRPRREVSKGTSQVTKEVETEVVSDAEDIQGSLEEDMEHDGASTMEGTTDETSTPAVRDILKVFAGECDSAASISDKKKEPPPVLRRKSLECTPCVKDVRKLFHSDIQAVRSPGVIQEEPDKDVAPKRSATKKKKLPSDETSLQQEGTVSTSKKMCSPTTRGHDEGTPKGRGILNDAGVSKIQGQKVCFSPLVSTITIPADCQSEFEAANKDGSTLEIEDEDIILDSADDTPDR